MSFEDNGQSGQPRRQIPSRNGAVEAVREPARPEPVREMARGQDDESRVRLRKGNQNIDPLYIPEHMKKPGVSYEWKRWEVAGKPSTELNAHHDQGFRYVPHSWFPGVYAPRGTDGIIQVQDMVLMERPEALTQQARQEEIDAANRQVGRHLESATVTTRGVPMTKPEIKTAVESLEIPE